MRILLLLLPIASFAAEAEKMGASERADLYEEHGMTYAQSLYLELDGSGEDELRSKKSDNLNQRIRERGIQKLEVYLAKTKDPKIRREILHRLSQLHEQQSEIISRRSDLKDKEAAYKTALRSSNRYLQLLRKEFPSWTADAILFNLAENHSRLKEDAQAEIYYRQVVNQFPKSAVVADSLLSLGNLYFERHAFQTARAFYLKILDTTEGNLHPYAHYKMAWCHFNENNFQAAVNRLEQAIFESRKLQQAGEKKLGVEEEALSDLVLFFAETGNPDQAKELFERLVPKQEANELRFRLVQRLFDHGKHQVARNTAKQLLDENPQKEFVNRLYLILISVAERTKDRGFGLDTARKLSSWLKTENLAKADTSRIESEEYMRLYSQKLHHEAETMKESEVWSQAKKSYDIYLETFPEEAETPEVKFRYAVLLMNRKDQLKAYKMVSDAVATMTPEHSRFKEALNLRIQSIELASPQEKKQIADKDVLAAYDSYVAHFPKEDLAVEAQYKAANVAKTLETPEQVAARYRTLAETHPTHNLAKASVGEALAVLVKAQKWEALGLESKALNAKSESPLLDKDNDLRQKIAEAQELSLVKITEGLEQEGKLAEARTAYEKILDDSPSPTMGIYSFVRLAALAEQKIQDNRAAIAYFEKLREKYPDTKEARQASLELARLYEKVNEPEQAVTQYLEYASNGQGKVEIQALTNAAVLLESFNAREKAAAAFFRLADLLKQNKKDAFVAYEAGCNNILLSYQNKDLTVLKKIQECAQAVGPGQVQWQARAAWAMDQMADNLNDTSQWRKIASRSSKVETERAYVALAKLRILNEELASLKSIQFQKTNEKPEANISKKTNALEKVEKVAEAVIKIGTPKQILAAKNVVHLAYMDFADTMENAALPSKLNEAESAELKKSFQAFAKEFRDKAAGFQASEGERQLASQESSLEFSSLSSEERSWLKEGKVPMEKAAEVYAKKAYASLQDGKFGEAKYFSEKWKKEIGKVGNAGYGSGEFDRFQALLLERLPEADPVSREF